MENSSSIRLLSDAGVKLIENACGHPEAARVLLPHWNMFVTFLLQNGFVTGGSIADIPQKALRAFSVHCDIDGGIPFHDAPLVLGAVRLILLWAGHKRQFLSDLSAPRVRRRVASNGKDDRRERVRPSADPMPQDPDQNDEEHGATTTAEGGSREKTPGRRKKGVAACAA